MRVKDKLRRIGDDSGSGAVKRYLLFLALIVTLGFFLSSSKAENESSPFNSRSFVFGSHSLDSLVQGSYVLPENGDFTLDSSKKLHERFPIARPDSLTDPLINPYVTGLFDSVYFSSYIASFVLPPLRSPPSLFS